MPLQLKTKLAGSSTDRAKTQPNLARIHAALRMLCLIAGMMTISLASGAAADDLSPIVVYHPGDTIHLVIAFKEVGVAFDGGDGAFALLTERHEGQKAFNDSVRVNRLIKLSDREFEVSGIIPEQTASGEYQLNWISMSSSGLSRMYRMGQDFQGKITVRIENPKRADFPDIKTLGLKH